MAEQRQRAKADAQARKGGGAGTARRRTGSCATRGATDVHRLLRAGGRGDGARAGPRRRAGRRRRPRASWSRSCSTRPRSTPSPAARTPTPASITGDGARARGRSTCSGRSRGWSCTPVRVGRRRGRGRRGRCTPRSTAEWRLGARQAHSGTHVVHAALRQVLGPTALQSGSYNRPGYLRLDFAWPQQLSAGDPQRDRGGRQPGDPGRPAGAGVLHAAGRRPGGSARWRCSARPTTRRSGSSRSAARGPASCAAAPTCSTPPRSARWRSPASRRSAPACAGSRRCVGLDVVRATCAGSGRWWTG